MSRITITCCFILCLMISAIPCLGQDGVITGRVTDQSGAVLPGVSISLTGAAVMGERSQVTSETGSYRFTLLPPGVYSLKFELPGFKTLVREGIQMSVGFSATVNVGLEVATVAETVTVTGESPVIDLESATVATNFNSNITNVLPNARDVWSTLAITPGIAMVTRHDVGGSSAGTQTGYRTYGTNSQNWYVVDGVIVTEGTGAASFYYDYGSFSEFQVAGASKTAEAPTPGAMLNFVVKTGSNDLHGQFYGDLSPGALEGNNINDDLRKRGVTEPEHRHRYNDINGDVGGPAMKDKFWWYTSLRYVYTGIKPQGFKTPEGQPGIFETNLRNLTLKLNYQLTPKNTLTYTGHATRKIQPFRGGSGTRAQYFNVNSVGLQNNPSWINKYQLTSILSQRATFDIKVGNFGYHFPIDRRVDELSRRDLDTREVRGGFSGENTEFSVTPPFSNRRRRWHLDSALAVHSDKFITGSHNLKVGYGWIYEGWKYTHKGPKDHVILYYNGGFARPSFIETFDTPFIAENGLRQHFMFLNDTWNIRKLTLNLGFRYDRYQPYYPEQVKPGTGPYQEKQVIQRQVFHPMHGPVPRVSLVYDFFGNGRTALKASYGMYSSNTGTVIAEQVNPISRSRKRYPWDGTLPFVPGSARPVFTEGGANRSMDPNLKLSRTIEYTAGIDQQIARDMTVRFNWVQKFERDKWQIFNTAIPFSAYNIPTSVTDPGRDGRVGTSDDRQITLYSLAPAFVGLRSDVLKNNPDYSSTFTTYEVEAVKRFSKRWQILTGVDWTHYKTWDDTAGVASENNGVPQDPNNRIFNTGRNYWHWQGKALGSYELPHGFTLSGSFRAVKGEPYGRRFTSPRLNQGTVTVTVEPVGAFFLDTVKLFDFRAQKSFRLSERWGKVEAIFDWFNLFNSAAVIGNNDLTGSSFQRITQTLPARIARLGVRYSF